jgi:hypothetical protein
VRWRESGGGAHAYLGWWRDEGAQGTVECVGERGGVGRARCF